MLVKHKNKIVVILGPTACGKTKLATQLALKFDGEIVSADSRQVYREMDIGTGKDLKDYKVKVKSQKLKVIPYHLIDVVSPKQNFNLAKYQKLAFEAIDDILQRKKLPILVGGSGLYLQAVVDNFQLSDSKPDLNLRKELEQLTIDQLFDKIKKLSPKMAIKINNSDKNNKRRLIRYVEILLCNKEFKSKTAEEKYRALIIGLNPDKQILQKKIYERIISRLKKEKMVNEVKQLHQKGLSWKKMKAFGLEYKFISLYLQNKLTYEEMIEKLTIATNQFANNQLSWFRRWEKQGRKINWIKNIKEAVKNINKFLN
ncbi:MAG: tRNA (adenosine(37)-N6)-dimethylallyltransferase MiaA [Patescibacteria group bacterium]